MADWTHWLGVFGRLHPLAVHLPIGFLLALAILEAVAYSQRTSLPRATVSVFVWLAALAAVFAAASGYTLSQEDGYGTSAVTLHLRLGIAVALTSVALAIVHLRAGDGTRGGRLTAYRALLGVTVLLLLPAGHIGSKIAHGEDFLTEPLHEGAKPDGAKQDGAKVLASEGHEKPAAKPDAISAEKGRENGVERSAGSAGAPAISYLREVGPIFSMRCSSCHGETKRKGGLSLKDPPSIQAGGRDGAVIVPGNPGQSEMVRRLRLPVGEDDHMPPPEKPQPTDEEIALIEKWIAAGAAFDAPGAQQWSAARSSSSSSGAAPGGESGPGAERPPDPRQGSKPGGAVAGAPGVASADPAAIEALRAKLVHVEPLAKDSSLLIVSFSAVAQETGDAEARVLLEPILQQVADLSLARSQIGDSTMKLVARMPNLSRLDVGDTAVSDTGVAALAGHAQLAELVLARTHLSDAAVESLLALPALKKVFVWNSGLGIQGLGRLRLHRPDLAIEAGAAASARPIETEKDVVLTKPASASGSSGTSAAPPTLGGALGVSPGASPAPVAAPAPVNTVCPVTGKPVDPAYQVVFKGKVVGFCCPKCPGVFWADPAKYESKLP